MLLNDIHGENIQCELFNSVLKTRKRMKLQVLVEFDHEKTAVVFDDGEQQQAATYGDLLKTKTAVRNFIYYYITTIIYEL